MTMKLPNLQRSPKLIRRNQRQILLPLAREVRRAMKLLQSGKGVAAYQTFETALAGGRGVMPRVWLCPLA